MISLFYCYHALLIQLTGSWRWRKLLSNKTTAVQPVSHWDKQWYLYHQVAEACKRWWCRAKALSGCYQYAVAAVISWWSDQSPHLTTPWPCLCPSRNKNNNNGSPTLQDSAPPVLHSLGIAVQSSGKCTVWPDVAFSLLLIWANTI